MEPCPEFHCKLDANHAGVHICDQPKCKLYPEPPAPMHGEHLPTNLFTVLELFPFSDGYITHACQECGALVNMPQHEKHVEWHNKVANL